MEFNLAQVFEAIAERVPDRECIVWRDRRLSWKEVNERSRRLANYLLGRGLALRAERASLEPWESGQDHVALLLYNSNEYLEGMLGAYKARLAPFNVNYRYVERELAYLLRDARARAIIYHASLAPRVAKVKAHLPELEVLIQVEDDSGNALVDGAVAYEEALAQASPERPPLRWSPDDLYILYTGGTTGMPKGVLWRQADIFVAALGGQVVPRSGQEFDSLDQIVERAVGGGATLRVMPVAPFMHGAAHWSAFHTFNLGGTVICPNVVRRLDARDVWETVERERVQGMLIVGDAFAVPLLDALESGRYDLSCLRFLVSGGAILSERLKRRFIELVPHLAIVDSVGSSETGAQGQHVSSVQAGVATGIFAAASGNVVLSEDKRRVLEPGSPEVGWLARTGRIPLGYLGDREKTERTFPAVGPRRFAVPGDRARLRADGTIELLGRESVTISSGGEKIFAEEVEHALKQHPAVGDAVVVGRPSQRWGEEVVAIVKLREGCSATAEELLAEAAKRLARYKLPKAFVFRDEIVRSPSGKADYRWAKT
ncbi:MAG: acyl-CoA synthetase, partial [Candidatus Dadabacteria bacterium]